LFPHLEEDLTDRMDEAYKKANGISEAHVERTTPDLDGMEVPGDDDD
jgi:hypothetical protein